MSVSVSFLRARIERAMPILDGGMATMIQRHGLAESGCRGERFANWPIDLEADSFDAPRVCMAGDGMEDLAGETEAGRCLAALPGYHR